jgi:hypothetical protein
MKAANARALANRFSKLGLTPDDVYRKFTEFGEPANEWKPGQVRTWAVAQK